MLGADTGAILSAFGTLAESGIKTYEKGQEDDKAKVADQSKLDAVIAADSAAALAKASALTSAAFAKTAPVGKTKIAADAKASADDAALSVASMAQDTASAALPASMTAKRVEAAQKAYAAAADKLKAAPLNAYNKNWYRLGIGRSRSLRTADCCW